MEVNVILTCRFLFRWAAWAYDNIRKAYAQLGEVLIKGLDEALVTLDEFFKSDSWEHHNYGDEDA